MLSGIYLAHPFKFSLISYTVTGWHPLHALSQSHSLLCSPLVIILTSSWLGRRKKHYCVAHLQVRKYIAPTHISLRTKIPRNNGVSYDGSNLDYSFCLSFISHDVPSARAAALFQYPHGKCPAILQSRTGVAILATHTHRPKPSKFIF